MGRLNPVESIDKINEVIKRKYRSIEYLLNKEKQETLFSDVDVLLNIRIEISNSRRSKKSGYVSKRFTKRHLEILTMIAKKYEVSLVYN